MGTSGRRICCRRRYDWSATLPNFLGDNCIQPQKCNQHRQKYEKKYYRVIVTVRSLCASAKIKANVKYNVRWSCVHACYTLSLVHISANVTSIWCDRLAGSVSIMKISTIKYEVIIGLAMPAANPQTMMAKDRQKMVLGSQAPLMNLTTAM